MLISHRHKFIFVHVQKTGGSSIWRALAPFCDPSDFALMQRYWLHSHSTATQIMRVVGRQIWDDYFTFAFERNPWDKCLSLYYYQLQNWHRYRKPFRPRNPTFRQWFYPYGFLVKKMRPSFEMYSDEGQICVKYLGRYERLQEDFAEICQRIGLGKVDLPVSNKSQLRTDPGYREHYTTPMRRRVERVFHREIELLGYSF